ncbi:MAG: hypothetical protein VW865_08375 [Halieaceae bacterium]
MSESPTPSSAPSDSSDTLWSFTGVELIPTADELTLLFDPHTGKRLLVRQEVGISLTYCEAFRTLRGHAEHLVATLPQLGGQVEPVVPVLQQIRDAGLFRSADELLGQFARAEDEVTPAPVEVFIITCDRPEAVERLLASMASGSGTGIPECFTVIDDSRDVERAARNRALVEAHNGSGNFEVRYFGLDERESYIAGLIASVPEHEASIRFLLDRSQWGSLPTYGLARTLALLLGVGKRVVIFDDDVLCEAVRNPLPTDKVQFGSITGRQAVFYPSADAMAEQKRVLRDSPIALMTRQLGSTLPQALSSLIHGGVTQDSLSGANGAFVRSLTPQSRIIQTQCSTWGDPGTGDGHWIVELDTESIDRLLDVEGGVSQTVEARATWLGYTAPTFTKHGVMSQVSGYDATQLLPPFLPAFRGEDNLFACMVTALHPESLVLNHEWAVPHHPIDQRAKRGLKTPIPAEGGVGLLTRWIGEQINPFEKLSPERRLTRLAESLASLAAQSHQDFLHQGQLGLAQWHAAQLQAYQHQLNRADSLNSQNWLRYLERGAQEMRQVIPANPSLGAVLAYPVDDVAGVMEQVQEGIASFARALEAWPSIWHAAASN